MNNLDIKKIMAEVETEVSRRKVANKYKKDLKLLEELGKIELKDNSLYDLKMQSYHTKTIQLPRSLKKGMVSKFSNKLIMKLYFVIGKMFDESLRIQQKINTKVIDEIIDIKKKISLVDLDHFPYAEFKKTFPVDQSIYDAFYEFIKENINNDTKIVDLHSTNVDFLHKLLSHNPGEVIAVNKNVEDISQMDVDERVVIEQREVFEYLTNSEKYSFNLVIMQDLVEFLDLNYLITILKEANKAMEKGGKIIIRTLNPQNDNVIKNTFDPKIQRLVHPQMMKFLLEYYNFENVNIYINNFDNQIGMEDYYVAVGQKI